MPLAREYYYFAFAQHDSYNFSPKKVRQQPRQYRRRRKARHQPESISDLLSC